MKKNLQFTFVILIAVAFGLLSYFIGTIPSLVQAGFLYMGLNFMTLSIYLSEKIRPHIKKIVYRPLLRVDVMSERLSSKEEIGKLALEVIGYDGSFLLKMFCHAKNKYHCTNRTVAKIKITEHPDGLKADVFESWRIARYWFWKK